MSIAAVIAFALASTQFTMSQGSPRTQATLCDAMYYGLGRAIDLAGAYKCYGADDDFQMQIVMALNGDGTPRDPRRIEAIFSTWEKKAPDDFRGLADRLRSSLASLQAGTLDKRIEFCHEIAFSTLEGLRCNSIREFRLKAEAARLFDDVARSLTS